MKMTKVVPFAMSALLLGGAIELQLHQLTKVRLW